jgi:hypothetical protein
MNWIIAFGTFVLVVFITHKAHSAEVGVSHQVYTDDRYRSGIGLQIRSGGTAYLSGGYESTYSTAVTQRLGKTQLYSLGAGYRLGSLYAELAYYHPEQTTRSRTLSEIIYYSFQPTFGNPPFLPDTGFHGLNYEYDLKGSYGISVGARKMISKRIGFDARYRALSLRESYAMQAPGSVFDPASPDSCGCRWEGGSNISANTLSLGIYIRF